MKIKRYKHKGKTVYLYSGATYGCLDRTETPVTKKPDKEPFLGVPTEELVDDGFVEVK